MPETAEEKLAREEQEKTDLENQKKDDEVKTKKDTYSASEYGEILSESIDRRKEIRTLKENLKKFEDAEKIKSEKDLEAKDLLTKRDAEILDLKNQMSQTSLRNEATTILMEQGFQQDFLKVAIPNDLTEDNITKKVKDFAGKYKKYATIKGPNDKSSVINPFQPGPEQDKLKTGPPTTDEVIQEIRDHVKK